MDMTFGRTMLAILSFLFMIYGATASNAGTKDSSYGTVLMAKFTENPYDPPAAVGADYID
jgi:hypothetical protein